MPDKSSLIDAESGIRDLLRLRAFNLTSHPVAVMMNFDTIFKSKSFAYLTV